MDTNTLISLVETLTSTLNQAGFEHIELNHEGTALVLNKKSIAAQVANQGAPVAYSQPAVVSSPQSIESTATPLAATSAEAKQPVTEVVDAANLSTIDSPIVGTYYDAPSPDAEPYIKIGDEVKKGDIVCIIEAMKLMNEIEAEKDGIVEAILVANEGPVEYGQPLIRLKMK